MRRSPEGVVYCDTDLAPCVTSCGLGHDAVEFGQDDCRCVPDNSLLCVTGGQCPSGTGAETIPGSTVNVCLNPEELRCVRTLACFESPNGEIARFAGGDCDRDGLTNGEEFAQGSLPCVAAPPIAFDEGGSADGGGCDALEACLPMTGCDGGRACDPVDGTGHYYCVTNAPGLFCCGGFFGLECPQGDACSVGGLSSDEFGLCRDPGYCNDADYLTRVDCWYAADDAAPRDDAAEGDCDGDGVPNDEEASAAAACVPNEDPDAGPLGDPDAGSDAGSAPAPDGGLAPDAGGDRGDAAAALIDGGPPTPSFGGGGGCRCRSSATAPAAGSWTLPFALALLSLRRRRPR